MINRNRMLVLTGMLAAMLLLALQATAQMGRGRGFGASYYDASNETVIHGVVETVQNDAYFCRWGGTEVALRTEKGTYNVVLGPMPFLSQSNFRVAKGDELSVTGFQCGAQTSFLIAREVTKGDKTLTLRNAQGFPVWAGRGMGWRASSGGCGRCGGPGCGRGWRWR